MKRILGIVMTLVLFLTVVNISPVHATPSKYTGGLLDGAVIQFGKKIGQPTGTGVTQMTDNNATTYARIELNNLAWYTFNSPQEITSVILKSEDAKYSMNFYDSNNNLLYTYNSVINDGIQTLPTPVKNVTMVVIKPSKTDFVFEWNVFKTASAPPSPTKINWIQGGDKIVTFDWNNTGAEHYTVKRSASPGGPFAILASINGTSYTDRAVTNGTTYYYVVSAGNEAGQSADSPQAIIKPSATKYTGGLLDGATLNVGASISTPTTTTRAITDNNVATYTRIETNNLAWYTFNSPKEITSVIINSEEPKSSINFYDRNNNLLYTYNSIIKDGVQTLPNPVKNVSTVVLKPSKTDLVIEWNVFTTASAPPAPTKINWIQARDKLVTFDWDLTGAKFYTVKRSTSSGGPYAVLASNITGTTYTDRAVTNGTTYYYVVSSGNEAGLSADSPQAAIKPNVTKYTGGLLDGATLNIGTSISNPRTTTRAITDNNVATYTRIETNNLAWYTFNSPKEITSVIINSEEPKSSIHFYDTNNNLLYTFNSIIKDGVQTLPNPIKNVSMVVLKPSKTDLVIEWNVFGYDQVPPTPKPSNLKATAGDTKVTLNWQLVNNTSQYHIKRANKSGGPYTTISTVTGNTYSYLDAGVANNTTYYYVVTANGPGGESGNSNEAYATPKQEFPPTPAPTNLIASAGDSTVTLIWQLVNDASQYHIKRGSTAGGPYTTIATVTGSTYGFVDMNLINDTTYYYVVTASGKGGESSHSNEVFATPTVGVSPASSLGQSDTQALHRYIVNNEIVRKITYQQQLSYLAHYWG